MTHTLHSDVGTQKTVRLWIWSETWVAGGHVLFSDSPWSRKVTVCHPHDLLLVLWQGTYLKKPQLPLPFTPLFSMRDATGREKRSIVDHWDGVIPRRTPLVARKTLHPFWMSSYWNICLRNEDEAIVCYYITFTMKNLCLQWTWCLIR